MFSRLDRYVLREMVPPFLIGSLVLVVMFQINYYMALGKTFDLANVPQAAVWKLILLQTPGFVNLTLPMSVSLAASLAMSRLARESELTALRAAGTRITRVVFPTALFGLLVGVIAFFVVDQATPRATREAAKLQSQVGILGSVTQFTSNVPLKLKNFTASLGSVTRQADESLSITDILLIERPEADKITITSAKNGSYREGLWRFPNAQTWRFSTNSPGIDYTVAKEMVINEKVIIADLFTPPAPNELSIKELETRIAEQKRLGQNTRQLEVEYHIKYSVPAMCLIFALVSPVFSIMFAKQGGFIGVLISVVIVLAYFNAWVVSTQILTKQAQVSPVMAAWLPNVIFFALGIIGLRRLE